MILNGVSHRAIVAAATADRVHLNTAALSRHRKHIIQTASGPEPEPVLPKATNIEILETIIQKGFGNSKNWKPTISDTMKAMDMWFRLTQGNPFDELLNTLAAASVGDDPADGQPDELEDSVEAD